MGDPSIGDLLMRLVASLAVVVGLLLLIARVANRRFASPNGAVVTVVQRQSIGRGQGVAVVSVGGRVLVLGTTEQQVTLLAEVEPEDIGLTDVEVDTDAEAEHATGRAVTVPGLVAAAGPLAGSLLSPQTWRQAASVVSGRVRPGRGPASPSSEASDLAFADVLHVESATPLHHPDDAADAEPLDPPAERAS